MPLLWVLPDMSASRSILMIPARPMEVVAVMREGLPNHVIAQAVDGKPVHLADDFAVHIDKQSPAVDSSPGCALR